MVIGSYDSKKKQVVIVADVDSKNWHMSKTGKSDVVSSEGFSRIDGTEYRFSINIIRPIESK